MGSVMGDLSKRGGTRKKLAKFAIVLMCQRGKERSGGKKKLRVKKERKLGETSGKDSVLRGGGDKYITKPAGDMGGTKEGP